ncbi:MAG: hypothetical protein R3297_11640, partial [Desulfobulbales bacterium]|nr:hypothetical protein [Desulfobulbales bacterium]
ENLFALLETGRKERDERNLNRFRAVLSVNGPLNAALTRAQFYFSRYAGRDDRMHIHVIPPDDIRDI